MNNTSTPIQRIACAECGQIHQFQPIAVGEIATCQRCSGILYRKRAHMVETSLALTLTGLILFILTNVFPLLELRAQGMLQEITLWRASAAFWGQDYHVLAVLLALNIIVFPLFELCAMLWVLLTIRLHWVPAPAIWLYRWMRELKPWGMLEIFMLGVLVAVVKLGDLATLIIGPAFWSFAFLIVSMAAATAVVDPFTVWNHLQGRQYDEQ